MLEITSARVIVTSPGRNFVTLRIETRDGLTGLGDATSSVVEPDRHHFNIVDGLADPDHTLTRMLVDD